jgi:hypothetical protein
MQFEATTGPFESELSPHESILWTGQPDATRWFTAVDWLLIPFGLIWLGFAILWEVMMLEESRLLGLVGIPLFLIALYFLVGRFFVKAWQKKRTFYAITNRRVLILKTGRMRSLTALEIKSLPLVEKNVRRNGSGTIYFGQRSFVGNPGYQRLIFPPMFEELRDVEQVYQVLKGQM